MGKWQSTIGEHGLWPTSLKNLSELVGGEGFNEYFRKQFNWNETSYLRWKEVFDVLKIGNAKEVGSDLPLEQQVLMITKSEDLVKLKALTTLCSLEFFDDPSLLVAVWRRILEILVLAMPAGGGEDKKGREKKKQKKKKADPKKLEILDACYALGKACGFVGDFDDCSRYYKRAKEGYKEQLGHDDVKTLKVTLSSICVMVETRHDERIEKLRDFVKRCESALGEENVVTFDALNQLGNRLQEIGEYEEAKEVHDSFFFSGVDEGNGGRSQGYVDVVE
ncbi:hypothetical protein TL16_g03847 [Triparma laevis f. inornata]|uniref:Uncharacterized protein n=1 Tax=Triparma laevis f. inornata TaxID=1714386 RepID=A0A9W7E303_9STRA|nr:hypothetical protein TL16_g03847 [Triparma laevis f. inornata]